jgi:hypothetical protein
MISRVVLGRSAMPPNGQWALARGIEPTEPGEDTGR